MLSPQRRSLSETAHHSIPGARHLLPSPLPSPSLFFNSASVCVLGQGSAEGQEARMDKRHFPTKEGASETPTRQAKADPQWQRERLFLLQGDAPQREHANHVDVDGCDNSTKRPHDSQVLLERLWLWGPA